jgi:monovalent cation:proton antiporter-2 (CPA2) family protein
MTPAPIHLPFIEELALFLVCAGIVVPLFRRLGVSPVLGFLIAGMAVGPFGLGRFVGEDSPWNYAVIRDLETTRTIAEFGVAFLLFVIGVELSPARLWALRRLVFGLGFAQVAVSALVIGTGLVLVGLGAGTAAIIGGCVALSSTAIVLQLLAEQGRLGTNLGRGAFAILLFQDLAVIPMLLVLAVLGSQSAGGLGWGLLFGLAKALVVVVALLAAGRLLLRPLFRLVSAARSEDLFLACALLVVIATSIVTHEAGMSLALGAFLAGVLLADTEFRHEVGLLLEPFKGLLLGLFFMSVGMGIDLAAVAERIGSVVWLVVALVTLKAGVLAGIARLHGLPLATAVELGLLLGPAGEFGFVLIGAAAAAGLVAPQEVQIFLGVVGVGMLVAPAAAWLGRRAGSALARKATADAARDAALPDLEGHFVIAGYGRVGRMLREVLDAEQLAFIAVDRDEQLVAAARRQGQEAYVGDAARPEFLARLGLDAAQALVVTTDEPDANERIVRAVRARWPELPILVRARDQEHAVALLAAGASAVVPETLEAGLELAEISLRTGGIPEEAARQLIDRRRAQILDTFRAPAR